jgi:hypothetical protein
LAGRGVSSRGAHSGSAARFGSHAQVRFNETIYINAPIENATINADVRTSATIGSLTVQFSNRASPIDSTFLLCKERRRTGGKRNAAQFLHGF